MHLAVLRHGVGPRRPVLGDVDRQPRLPCGPLEDEAVASGDISHPMSVSGGRGSVSTTPEQPGIRFVDSSPFRRPHPGGEVVVDPQVVQRRGHRREVTVPDEGVVGEVRRVVEEPVGVGAVEDRSEEEPVEGVVGPPHRVGVTLVAVLGSPHLRRVEGDRDLGVGAVLADHRHGGAVRQHEVMSRDHRLEGVLCVPGHVHRSRSSGSRSTRARSTSSSGRPRSPSAPTTAAE